MYRSYAHEQEDGVSTALILYDTKKPAAATVVKESSPSTKEGDASIPSFIKQLDEGGGAISVIDGEPAVMTNFLVTNINETVQSISKIAQHFAGKWNIFFFGSAPTMVTISGKLIDSPDAPYYEGFRTMFENNIIGGTPVEGSKKVVFVVDGRIITGYFLGCSFNSGSDFTKVKEFQLSMVMRSHRFVRPGGRQSLLIGSRKIDNIDTGDSSDAPTITLAEPAKPS